MEAKIIDPADIWLAKRARKELGDLSSIKRSMSNERIGQIQSLAVVSTPDKPKPYKLLAGGRRFKSLLDVGITEVLVRVYPEDTDGETQKAIELIENMARQDLEWHERCALTAEIHALQTELNKDWSQAQTAKHLGMSTATISRDLEMSKSLEVVPELKDCKTQKDALGLQEKLIEQQLKNQLLEMLNAEDSEVDVVDPRTFYLVGDSLKLIKDVPDSSIDFIDLDPDYGVDIDIMDRKDRSTVTEEFNRRSYREHKDDYVEMMTALLPECLRVLKPTGWMIVWHSMSATGAVTMRILCSHYPKLITQIVPGMWLKNNISRNFNADTTLGKKWEPFFYSRKEKGVLIKRGRPNVFVADIPTDRIHPTEKPKTLMKDILETFCLPGAKVLVPFAGSGNTLLAAHELMMEPLGFDLS